MGGNEDQTERYMAQPGQRGEREPTGTGAMIPGHEKRDSLTDMRKASTESRYKSEVTGLDMSSEVHPKRHLPEIAPNQNRKGPDLRRPLTIRPLMPL